MLVPAESALWYVLRTQPKHEHIAARRLRLIEEVEVFCPRLRFQRPTVNGPKWFVEAMFPGYLFARFTFLEHHREVRHAPGIIELLQFGERYAYLDESIITDLRELTESGEVIEVAPELAEGAPVRVVHGALRGFEAVITHVLPGRERVRILLSFLGREIEAEVTAPAILPPRHHPLTKISRRRGDG